MFLTSIEMFGFKSFADKSRILFDKGISIVVGPNGCGKSNVVDALRWVLGEQGAKGLRADKMTGVIFNGTDARHPLNVAEVSLTFSNDKNILPLEFSEVEIKRRVFRDGAGEYYINKNQVALREIRELLADTGVGTTDYVVMEQGRIDQILESKPTERRQILEEAAGIVKHRMRSLEGSRRLEKVQANKQQLLQVLSEVESRHKTLQVQCEKALQYRELKEIIFTGEVRRACAKYNDMQNSRARYDADRDRLAHDQEQCNREIDALNKESESFLSATKQHQSSMNEEQGKISSITARMQGAEESIAKSEEYLTTVDEQLDAQREQREQIRARAESHRKEYETVRAQVEEQQKKLFSIDQEIDQIRARVQHIREQDTRLRENIATSFERDKSIDTELEVHQKDLRHVVDRLAAELDKQLVETGYSAEIQAQRETVIVVHIRDIQKIITRARDSQNNISADEIEAHVEKIAGEFEAYKEAQPIFLREFLAGDGVLSRKHVIDKKIAELRNEKTAVAEQRERDQAAAEQFVKQAEALNEQMQSYSVRKASEEQAVSFLREQAKRMENTLADFKRQEDVQSQNINRIEQSKKRLTIDIEQQRKQLVILKTQDEDARSAVKKLRAQIENQTGKIEKYAKKIQDAQARMNNMREQNFELEQKQLDINTRCNVLTEQFAERYGELLSVYLGKNEYKNLTSREVESENIPKILQDAKNKLKTLGGVNLLAPDEFRQINERYGFLTNQLADLESAEQDLQQVVEEIERESRQKLETTYKEVRKHFKKLFIKLMDGGFADIEIIDSDDILTAGLEIIAQPPEKKTKHLSQLSGGERTLVALAMLFAIHSVRPAPFCVLDELDAPLDEQNIGRFLSLLDEFSHHTQFVIISHNKRTIAYGSQLIGVTMEERGVSKIIGVKTERS